MLRRKSLAKAQPFLYPLIKWYYRKPRLMKKRGLKLTLYPTVFHPTFYLSTDLFLDYLLTLNLENVSILELGTGNGFIALYLAKHGKGLNVFASDINEKAIEGLKENIQQNSVNITTYVSDLFDDIPQKKLDYIIIKPPYFSKEIESTDEYAFFTGPDLAYFKKFFQQIQGYLEQKSKVLLILSETAPLDKIKDLAKTNGMILTTSWEGKSVNELFYIYQLSFKLNGNKK